MDLPLDALKSLILGTGLLSEKDFDNTVKEAQRTEKDVVDVLVSRNYITRDYYAEMLAQYFKVPRVKLIGEKIPKEILNLIPEEIARTRNEIVFNKSDSTISVAMLDPANLEALEFLEKYTGYFVKPYLALEEDLQSIFAQYGQVVSSDFQKTIQENIQASLKLKGVEAEKAATEFPIVSLTDNLISYAASLRSTDIHIEL